MRIRIALCLALLVVTSAFAQEITVAAAADRTKRTRSCIAASREMLNALERAAQLGDE